MKRLLKWYELLTLNGYQLGLSMASNVISPLLLPALALDALFGGFRAYLERVFDDKVFVVSFTSNVLIAALIVWLGDQIGVGAQLSTAVVVVLGIRIFTNAAAIRRALFHA